MASLPSRAEPSVETPIKDPQFGEGSVRVQGPPANWVQTRPNPPEVVGSKDSHDRSCAQPDHPVTVLSVPSVRSLPKMEAPKD